MEREPESMGKWGQRPPGAEPVLSRSRESPVLSFSCVPAWGAYSQLVCGGEGQTGPHRCSVSCTALGKGGSQILTPFLGGRSSVSHGHFCPAGPVAGAQQEDLGAGCRTGTEDPGLCPWGSGRQHRAAAGALGSDLYLENLAEYGDGFGQAKGIWGSGKGPFPRSRMEGSGARGWVDRFGSSKLTRHGD